LFKTVLTLEVNFISEKSATMKIDGQEAGRKGDQKVARERGVDFYRSIERKGGEKVAEVHGSEFYREIGRKGGESRKNSLTQARRGSTKGEVEYLAHFSKFYESKR
jgi:general stress protein YciG